MSRAEALGDPIRAVDTPEFPAGVECRVRISSARRKIDAPGGNLKSSRGRLHGAERHELTGSNLRRRRAS
jgi:hypothetical protein